MSPTDPSTRTTRAVWTYALVGGLVSLPVTAAAYWQTGTELSLNVVFLGGLLAGTLARRQGLSGTRTGFRAGLVGSLPALWMGADLGGFVAGLAEPAWFRAVQVVVLVVLVAALFGLGALLGSLGGRLGAWFVERFGGRRPSTAGR
ncbi:MULTISPECIES: DUF5518 domain-containing protein [Haloarcula]|uniref:DUF5518 domain-containing protein n=1 Tax=Haloarcula TaxID=2237 RepID=UPI0023EAA244|nr:DUF5518 domain-containing protein [Halomicroarcula sp. XH51]